MINELNQEQTELMEQVKDEYVLLLRKHKKLNTPEIKANIDWFKKFVGLDKAEVVICKSPMAMQKYFNKKYNKNQKSKFYYMHYYAEISSFGWVAFYDYFQRIGVEYSKELKENFQKYKEFITSGIYSSILHSDIITVCEMPTRIELDPKTAKLHCETDHAIEWSDGYKLAFLYGHAIEDTLFEKFKDNTLTFKEIMTIDNIETRYALIKAYGGDKLITESKAKLIHETEKGNKLYEIEGLIEDRKLKLLRYVCPSTDREYFKWVEDKYTNADQAQAEYHGYTLEQYEQGGIES